MTEALNSGGSNSIPTDALAGALIVTPDTSGEPKPDPSQALAFFGALFPEGAKCVHFRAVPEPKGEGRTPTNHHYQLDDKFPAVIADFLAYCATDSRAAFFLPAIANAGKTHKDAVASMPAITVDFDKGDPAVSLAAAEAIIGAASIVVESGGSTSEGHTKLHAYWRLTEPATGADIATVCAVREELAKRFGGDPAFKQEAQVIRIPGSLHLKSAPRLVTLRKVGTSTFELPRITRALGVAAPAPSNFFDFSHDAVAAESQLDRALTAPVHAEGKDGITRYNAAGSAIGHFVRMIREGKLTEDQAWRAALDWNQATLVPPWSEERLRGDFERLKRIDLETHGAIVPVVPFLPVAPADRWALTDWRADSEIDEPLPPRQWLVEGVIPAGTPGVFAAVGDAGKSMMTLQLALYVTSYPVPQNASLGFNDAPAFLGGPVLARGAAVILTSEDDKDEVQRRLAALDPTKARRGKPLYVVPMVSAGGARAIITKGPGGSPAPTEFWFVLREQLMAIPGLRLIVLDPLSSFVGADTNDNAIGTATMMLLGELAAATGAAVMVTHHFAKGRDQKINNLSDAREAIRGAGAWVDNGRWAAVLWEADQDYATSSLDALGQKERAKQAGIVYRGGLTKGNAPSAKVMRTFVRNAGTGLLEDVTEALRRRARTDEDVMATLHAAMLVYKQQNPAFAFTASASALWPAWRPFIKKHNLPITKDGKRAGYFGVEAVFDQLMDARLIAETADRAKSPRYEPVAREKGPVTA